VLGDKGDMHVRLSSVVKRLGKLSHTQTHTLVWISTIMMSLIGITESEEKHIL